jgi:long-subunit acyl-CoA synthetase (AMP-forming)
MFESSTSELEQVELLIDTCEAKLLAAEAQNNATAAARHQQRLDLLYAKAKVILKKEDLLLEQAKTVLRNEEHQQAKELLQLKLQVSSASSSGRFLVHFSPEVCTCPVYAVRVDLCW